MEWTQLLPILVKLQAACLWAFRTYFLRQETWLGLWEHKQSFYYLKFRYRTHPDLLACSTYYLAEGGLLIVTNYSSYSKPIVKIENNCKRNAKLLELKKLSLPTGSQRTELLKKALSLSVASSCALSLQLSVFSWTHHSSWLFLIFWEIQMQIFSQSCMKSSCEFYSSKIRVWRWTVELKSQSNCHHVILFQSPLPSILDTNTLAILAKCKKGIARANSHLTACRDTM